MNRYQIKTFGMSLLRDKATDDPAPGGPAPEPKKDDPAPETKGGNVTLTQEQFDALMAKVGGGGAPAKDKDLYDKTKDSIADKDKSNNDSKRLESAIKFTMQSKEWVKENQSLLPKEVQGILDAADKETYDSAIQKDGAVKSGIVQSFFHVQENLDLLTASQKSTIEDFLKLSKNGKEEKAQAIYDSIFEPTFEMKKRISKAAQLNRAGERSGDDAEEAYKAKLMNGSKQHYMGVKTQ